MLLRRQSFAKCNKPPRPRPLPPSSLWRGATSPTSSSRTSFFLSLVAISYSLDLSPAGLTIVLSHQEELISSPSIPRVFSQPFHRSQESPSLFQIYFTRCIQSPRQARKSHNLRQEPLSSFHLRRLPLFSAGRDLHQVDSSSLVPVYPPSMEMIVTRTTRVFSSP